MRLKATDSLTWDVIQRSKKGKKYVDSRQQFLNLYYEVKKLKTLEERQEVQTVWFYILNELCNGYDEAFNELANYVGSVVQMQPYEICYPLADWLITQGNDLYVDLHNRGIDVVLAYIKRHNVNYMDIIDCHTRLVFNHLEDYLN